ncbi:MAG: SIS domain-containing protein [Deinococcota bacterium]
MIADSFLTTTTQLLSDITQQEQATLSTAVDLFTATIRAGGIIHSFGTGHSSMLACEGLYRAGGLACVNAILEPHTTFEIGAVAGGRLERTEGLAAGILDRYKLSAEDTFIIFSNSGVNALPLEIVREVRARGLKTVAVTSRAYATQTVQARGGQSLLDLADVVIDTHVPPGDAALELTDPHYRMGSVSTICTAFIWNVLISEAANVLLAEGHDPPIYISSNMPGAAENNEALVARYRDRIRHL